MAGCGYVCPVCEGRGYTDDGKPCSYCVVSSSTIKKDIEAQKKEEISDQEWIDKVHNSSCCSDIGQEGETTGDKNS